MKQTREKRKKKETKKKIPPTNQVRIAQWKTQSLRRYIEHFPSIPTLIEFDSSFRNKMTKKKKKKKKEKKKKKNKRGREKTIRKTERKHQSGTITIKILPVGERWEKNNENSRQPHSWILPRRDVSPL